MVVVGVRKTSQGYEMGGLEIRWRALFLEVSKALSLAQRTQTTLLSRNIRNRGRRRGKDGFGGFSKCK